MDAQGQQTYQVVGDPEVRERGADASGEVEADASGAVEADASGDAGADAIPDSDVAIVAERAGVGEADAREALAEADGDLAAAIARFE
jgi:nascent polypeptide-associated complex subunit alpha